jgi:uncharacterized coiled-coil DUF342 family protein
VAALEAVKAQAAEYAAEADAERQAAAAATARAARLADQLEAASAQLAALQADNRQVGSSLPSSCATRMQAS